MLKFRNFWKPTLLAQILSIVICGTGIVNSKLSENYNINIPTGNFLNFLNQLKYFFEFK